MSAVRRFDTTGETPVSGVFRLLRGDIERQLFLEGKTGRKVWMEFLKRCIHPRFLPLFLYRWSRAFFLLRIPGLPFVLSYINLVVFGIQITPRCEIGPGLFLPHSVGTVIGAWKVGSDVTIFQGVTLGAKRLDFDFSRELLPVIGDRVTIGAGAKILGGITIGDDVTVGANAVVLDSVISRSTVGGVPARVLKSEVNSRED